MKSLSEINAIKGKIEFLTGNLPYLLKSLHEANKAESWTPEQGKCQEAYDFCVARIEALKAELNN
jgi:hypothetical protein